MPDEDIAVAGVVELLDAFRTGRSRPSAALKARLARIEAVDQHLGAVQSYDPRAIEAAEASDKRWSDGHPRSLEGVPFGLKDVIEVAGLPTRFGASDFAGYESAVTADVADRLLAAGAIHVAKLNTYEFAAGPNNLTKNPWQTTHMCGGSSSGPAAAVAARLLPLTIGTDTGGSIRVPAAWCGVVGVKPTRNRVSCHGVAPLSWTLDHVGPIVVKAVDADLALRVMSARRPAQGPAHTFESGVAGMRLGRPADWFFDACQPEVQQLVEEALDVLANAGATIVDVDIPWMADLDPDLIKHILVGAEAAALHEPREAEWGHYTPGFRDTLLFGKTLSATDYVKALRMRSVLTRDMLAALRGVDALLTPTSGLLAPPRDTTRVDIDGQSTPLRDAVAHNTSVFNICGFPALTVPCGFSSTGLPAGLQIISLPWRDETCLRIAATYQDHTGHHRRIPPLSIDERQWTTPKRTKE